MSSQKQLTNEQIYKKFIKEYFSGMSKQSILKELDVAFKRMNDARIYKKFISENFKGKSKEEIAATLDAAMSLL